MNNKFITLQEFLNKLQDAAIVMIDGRYGDGIGVRENLPYFVISNGFDDIRFNKHDNMTVEVFNREDGELSFAKLHSQDGSIVDVRLFSNMKL